MTVSTQTMKKIPSRGLEAICPAQCAVQVFGTFPTAALEARRLLGGLSDHACRGLHEDSSNKVPTWDAMLLLRVEKLVLRSRLQGLLGSHVHSIWMVPEQRTGVQKHITEPEVSKA